MGSRYIFIVPEIGFEFVVGNWKNISFHVSIHRLNADRSSGTKMSVIKLQLVLI